MLRERTPASFHVNTSMDVRKGGMSEVRVVLQDPVSMLFLVFGSELHFDLALSLPDRDRPTVTSCHILR